MSDSKTYQLFGHFLKVAADKLTFNATELLMFTAAGEKFFMTIGLDGLKIFS